MQNLKKAGIVLFIFSVLIACSQKKPDITQLSSQEPSVEKSVVVPPLDKDIDSTEILSPVKAPGYSEALVTFVTGNVYRYENGEWIYLEIGDFLSAEDSVKTDEDSNCELQFGDRAVVRIEESTQCLLNSVFLKPSEAKVGIKLLNGTIVCRVQKLVDNEKFNVETQSATCGVRGTEFSVKQNKGKEFVLAVKKGAVAVLPPEYSGIELVEIRKTDGLLTDVLNKIESSAPVVTSDKEVVLAGSLYDDLAGTVKELAEAVDVISRARKNNEEPSEYTFKLLETTGEKVSSQINIKELDVVEISESSRDTLEKTESMDLLDIPLAEGKGKDSEKKVEEAVLGLHKIIIKTDPSNAGIFLNGEPAGVGRFSGIYVDGTVLDFDFKNEGYESRELSMSISKDTERKFSVKLRKIDKLLREEESKDTNESVPAFEKSPDKETVENDTAVENKKEKIVENIIISENVSIAKTSEAVPGEKKLFPISIRINPDDSDLIIDGKPAGRGMYSADYPAGSILHIVGKRRGFAAKTVEVSVGSDSPVNVVVDLEPKPVEAVIPVSRYEISNSISAGRGILVASDVKGAITAINTDGRLIWKIETKNDSAENSHPVLSGNRVFYSGPKELIIADVETGRIIKRQDLDSNSAHIFGRKLVSLGDYEVFPANNELRILKRNTGAVARTVSFPGESSRMTPGVWRGKILLVSPDGVFRILNSSDGSVEGEISTGGIQPIALSVAVINNLAVFSGRKGNVVCIDLIKKNVLWESKIPGEKIQVYSDIVLTDRGAYLYSKGTIYGLSLGNGSLLFEPVHNASAPPSLIGSDLVFGGANNELVFLDPLTGRQHRSLKLEETVSTRPSELNGMIAIGTTGGKVIIVDPEGIR